MNVFDLRGPEFLAFYFWLLAVGAAAAALVRQFMRLPGDIPPRLPALDSFQIAYLSGGQRGAVHAAIASLAQRGVIKAKTSRLEVAAPLTHEASPFETEVFHAVVAGHDSPSGLQARVDSAAERLAKPLEGYGLVYPKRNFGVASIVPGLIMLGVLVVGLVKIAVGISRNRPVGYLIFFCLVAAIVAALMFRKVHRTLRGDRILRRIRDGNAALNAAAGSAATLLAPNDLALAVGLFGLGMLSGGDLDSVSTLLKPARRAGDSSWYGCSSASCGGGGGSGCGGGGCGGGCGGCGG